MSRTGVGSKGNRRDREPGELEKQLQYQLAFIRRSCEGFDAGNHFEGIDIASKLRTLLHDSPQSHGLLSQLGIRDKVRFLDTGVYRTLLEEAKSKHLTGAGLLTPETVLSLGSPDEVGLVELGRSPDGSHGWFPPLRPVPTARTTYGAAAMRPPQPFATWWNDPVTEASNGSPFSRRNLVLILTNQDGGAHVDPQIDADFPNLTLNGTGLGYTDQGGDTMLAADIPDVRNNVAWASVRQIAFELLMTLELHLNAGAYPGIFALRSPFEGLPVPEIRHQPVDRMTPVLIAERLEEVA